LRGTGIQWWRKVRSASKGTPAYDQVIAKLNAALASYEQSETDLKGVL